jgi:hypothetical protein
MKKDVEYFAEDAEVLVGGMVVGIIVDTDNEFFGLAVRKNDKKYHVWVLQDPEGNGTGFLDIEEA